MSYLGIDISDKELEKSDIFDRGVNKENREEVKKINESNTTDTGAELTKVLTEDQTIDDLENISVKIRIWSKLVTFAVADGLDPKEKDFLITLAKKIGIADDEIEDLIYNEQKEIALQDDDEREVYLKLAIDLAKADGIITNIEKDRIVKQAEMMGLNRQIITFLGKLIQSIQESDDRLTVIQAQNEEINAQNEEIQAQSESLQKKNDLLEKQNTLLAEQQKHILASITYAKLIQKAFLPHPDVMAKLPEHFVLYKPKDIVSGDYYWVKEQKNRLLITAADCTGHGVPGAFMSVLGSDGLDHIMTEPGSETFSPGMILNKLRDYVKSSLDQEKTESKDGMDMALIALDKEKKYLEYAGAYNPLYIINNGKIKHEIKATKSPVGIHVVEKDFETTRVELEPGDMIYMFSDGYVDQFGGPNGKKLRAKNFKEILCSISDKPQEEQKVILEKVIKEWMDMGENKEEQIDDIIVMGIRV